MSQWKPGLFNHHTTITRMRGVLVVAIALSLAATSAATALTASAPTLAPIPSEISLAGPAHANVEGSFTYTGEFQLAGTPLPLTPVEILADGATVGIGTTGVDGTYAIAADFSDPGIFEVVALAGRGTPIEATSEALFVMVGPGVLTLTGPSYANVASDFTYTGVLTLGGEPVPSQLVEFTVDGVALTPRVTDANGAFEAPIRFPSKGFVELAATAMRSTAAETAATSLQVVVGPGQMTLGGATTAARNAPVTLSGVLSVGGETAAGVPILGSAGGPGATIGSGATDAAGAYSVPATFTKRGTHTVTTTAYSGTPAETTASHSVNVDAFISVVAGDGFTCGLQTDGTVWCWGRNERGQLGDGTYTSSSVPVKVLGVSNAFSIAAGGQTACALSIQVLCWGDNAYGQLGRGYQSGGIATAAPTQVFGGGHNALQVEIGGQSACAVMNTNIVYCWGSNLGGELGLGYFGGVIPTPTSLGFQAFGSQMRIAVGAAHACALKADKNVHCWGANFVGQLGVNDYTARASPTPVWPPMNSAESVHAGNFHTCALVQGYVACWGQGAYGQLGYGYTADQIRNNVVAQGITTAKQVATGAEHTCALLADGSMKCWGANGAGALGDGTFTNRLVPVTTIGVANGDFSDPNGWWVRGIAAGLSHTCVKIAGTLRCTGYNAYGQLGDGTLTYRTTMVEVL